MLTFILIALICAAVGVPGVDNEDITSMAVCIIGDILIFKDFGGKTQRGERHD